MNSTPNSIQPPIETDRDELIRLHLPLAYRLAACYRSSGRPYEKLVESAEIGLVRAAEKFQGATAVSFRAFATPMITAELRRAARGGRDARFGGGAEGGEPRADAAAAQQRLATALGAGPRVNDLARLLAVDPEVVAEALVQAAGRQAVTLNLPAARRGGYLEGISGTPAAA